MQAIPMVSIVIRTIGRRPVEIRRAISSIAANSWRPLEVIVVYQGKKDTQWDDLQQLPKEFPSLLIFVIRNSASGDRRAENLNIGWKVAQGRYLGFLDDDDSLAPNHVALLIEAMQATGCVWAYAQVLLRKEDEFLKPISETKPFKRHKFSLKSLWQENFLPIHSFLIDRASLHREICQQPFFEDLDRSEDWDFLLRLAFWHEPTVIEEFTAIYHIRTGAHNTNLSLMNSAASEESQRENRDAWAHCKAIVEQRKIAMINSIWWAHEYFDIEPKAPISIFNKILPLVAHSGMQTFRQRIIRKLIRILERAL